LGENPGLGPAELHHQFGFVSRPRDPDRDEQGEVKEGKACNLWFGTEGNATHAELAYDPRFVETFKHLKKGGSMRYAAPGSFEVFDGDDGTNTLYVPTPDNKAHVVTTGVDGNQDPYIGIVHSTGMAMTMLHKSLTLKNAAGDAYIEVNDSGNVLNGAVKIMGSLICGDPVSAQPAAVAFPIVSYLTALEALLLALATALDVKLAPTGGVNAGLVTTFMGLQAATKTAMGALKTSIA